MKHEVIFLAVFRLDSGNICQCCESTILWFGIFTISFSSFCKGAEGGKESEWQEMEDL